MPKARLQNAASIRHEEAFFARDHALRTPSHPRLRNAGRIRGKQDGVVVPPTMLGVNYGCLTMKLLYIVDYMWQCPKMSVA